MPDSQKPKSIPVRDNTIGHRGPVNVGGGQDELLKNFLDQQQQAMAHQRNYTPPGE